MASEGRNELDPKEIARAAFPAAFRGYDQDSVRQYLTRLAQAVARAQQRGLFGVDASAVESADTRARQFERDAEELRHTVIELEGRLAAEAARANDSPMSVSAKDLSESDLIELLGQETARVLGTARMAAADTVSRANAEALEITDRAQEEADQTRKEAELALTTARAEGRKIKDEAAAEIRASEAKVQAAVAEAERASRVRAEQILSETAQVAEAELVRARQDVSRIIRDAESLREEILTDLLRRRRVNQEQLDRLVEAKRKLATTLSSAQAQIDGVATEIRSAQVENVEIDLEEIELTPSDEELDELRTQLTGTTPTASTPIVGSLSTTTAGEDDTHQLGARPKGRGASLARADEPVVAVGAHEADLASVGGFEASFESGDGARADRDTAVGALALSDDLTVTADRHMDDISIDVFTDGEPGTSGLDAEPTAGDEVLESEVGPNADAESASQGNDQSMRFASTEDDTVVVNIEEELEALSHSLQGYHGVEIDDVDHAPTGEMPAVDELTAFESPTWTWDDAPSASQELAKLAAGEPTAEVASAQLGDGQAMPADAYVDVFERDIELETTPLLGKDPSELQEVRATDHRRGDLPRNEAFEGHLPYGFESRDIALSRSTPGFKRRLKRAVNDDQSHVLDCIRSGHDVVKASELPKYAEQLEGYLSALRPALLDVVRSGGELQGSVDVPYQAVENLSLQLAKHLVDCVRQPTVEAIDAAATSDREAIMDPIRATYRDFRNSVLPDLIDDALHEAFSLGLYHGIGDDQEVVWVVDPRLDPDPICEENSASAPLAKGSVFASGHIRPLSMPGCRCLVMPANQ